MAFKQKYKTKFGFVEQSNQVYYHDIRVFIMGTEVSPWLTSDVSVSYSKNGGINSASFTLSNQYNAFVLTEANLLNITDDSVQNGWRLQDPYSPSGQYSESAKHSIWKTKNDRNKDGSERNVRHKVSTFGPLANSNNTKASILKQSDDQTSAVTYKYPMSPGSLVIHKFDQVRIFAKNPLIMNNEWMCVFTGFVDTKPYTQDLVNGMSTIRITCQDIRYAMQRMRTQVNPAAVIGNENAFQFNGGGVVGDGPKDGYFNDLVGPNFKVNHVLGGVTFIDSIKFLLLGENVGRASNATAGELTTAEAAGTNLKKSMNAVGELTLGEEISYDPSDRDKAIATLEEWNDLVMFREFGMMTEAAMLEVGQGTTDWGEFSVWKSKVHILRPADGLPISNLVETSVTGGMVKDKVQWASRLELLLNICENLDYVFYVSPWGDVIFEFPMWDFSPTDFGEKYAKVYTFQDHVISRDVNDEGGDAVSAVTVESAELLVETRNAGSGDAPGRTDGVALNTELTRTIYSNALASRIGVQVKTIVKPGVKQENLDQLGMIEFAKAIADYNRYSFKTQYRPFLMVNRPIYDVEAYKIGSLNNLTTTWRLRENVENELDLTYVRSGEIDKDRNISFRFITGGERSTISYNTVYRDTSIKWNTGQGVGSAKPDSKEGDGT